jgi:hypothetical protein
MQRQVQPFDVTKALKESFETTGRVCKFKGDAGLTKSARFIIEDDKRNVIREIPIGPYSSLPCYCPFLMYKVRVKLASPWYNVERVIKCRKSTPKTGVLGVRILPFLSPTEKKKVKKVLPKYIKTLRDVKKMKLDPRTFHSVKSLMEPYFRGPVFLDMIRYFPYSLLRRLTDNEIYFLRDVALKTPHTFCFRIMFKRVLKVVADMRIVRLKQPLRFCFDFLSEYAITDGSDLTYSIEKWKNILGNDIVFDPTCPIWSINTMVNFCVDHNVPITPEYSLLVKRVMFSYIACEKEKSLHHSNAFDMEKFRLKDYVDFLQKNCILNVDMFNTANMIESDDSIAEVDLIKHLKLTDTKVFKAQCNVEEIIDLLITELDISNDPDSDYITIAPNISMSLYLSAKIEKGTDFQREKPKRGRKRKVQETGINEFSIEEKPNSTIFYPLQWLQVCDNLTLDEKSIVFICAEEFSTRLMVKCLSVFNRKGIRPKSVYLVGNPDMWAVGIPYTFNVISKSVKKQMILEGKKKRFKVSDMLSQANGKTRTCDIYHNEDKFAESLNDWLKNKNIKWESKTILFTNKSLMTYVTKATCERMFKASVVNALYTDMFVYVKVLGLYGILKKAHFRDEKGIWSNIEDQSVAIFPQIRKYILRIEDYYTKSIFTIDTTKYEVMCPLFCMLSEAPCVPFEAVVIVVDNSTTKNDIKRAAALSKNIFSIYYRKEVNIEGVIGKKTRKPKLSLEDKLVKYPLEW